MIMICYINNIRPLILKMPNASKDFTHFTQLRLFYPQGGYKQALYRVVACKGPFHPYTLNPLGCF